MSLWRAGPREAMWPGTPGPLSWTPPTGWEDGWSSCILVPEVQVLVVRAFFNRAGAKQNAGEAEAAVTGLTEVVTRFGGSNEPDIQECVARALLNRGFLQGRLGEREAAIASYDDAIGRF